MHRIKIEIYMEKELTKAELEIMKILWDGDKMFVNEILDKMPNPKPAYNTVSTFVRLLEKKGIVSHNAFGKSHQYYPLITKEQYTSTFMHGVMTNFFDNSLSQLFSFFSKKEELSITEIERIITLAKKAIDSNNQDKK